MSQTYTYTDSQSIDVKQGAHLIFLLNLQSSSQKWTVSFPEGLKCDHYMENKLPQDGIYIQLQYVVLAAVRGEYILSFYKHKTCCGKPLLETKVFTIKVS